MKIKLLAVHIGLVLSSSVFAEGIATDGTMGAAQPLSGANVEIPQTLGKTAGNNLFHSFSDFNINAGQTVTFSGSDNLRNVISRVTGANPSLIDGTLKSEIKNADFYFINPNGITFGSGASVDVPAAFHVTTADKMDFGKNGGVFYSDKSKNSSLSSESPAALGFLGTSKANNGLLKFDNTKLELKEAQTMDVVAGQISVKGWGRQYDDNYNPISNIKIPSGNIRFVAMQGDGNASLIKNSDGVLPLPEITPSNAAAKIVIDDCGIDTSGNGAGRVSMWGGETIIQNANLLADNIGKTNATNVMGVYIRAKTIELTHGGKISSSSGNINFMETGNAGSVNLDASENIILGNALTKNTDGSESISICFIYSRTVSTNGDAGTISLKGKNINLISSHIESFADAGIATVHTNTSSLAKAGKIILEASKNIKLGSTLRKDGFVSGSYINSATFTNGDAGAIILKGKNIELIASSIDSQARSSLLLGSNSNEPIILNQANAGTITLDASENIKLGSVIIKDTAGEYWGSNIFSNTYTNGDAGSIIIRTKGLDLINGGEISSSTKNHYYRHYNDSGLIEITNPIYVKGKGGDVSITANTVKLDGKNSQITASTISNGAGGKVDIQAKTLEITNDGSITVGSFLGEAKENSSGKTGHINIKADEIHLASGGKINNENQSTVEDAASITPGTITINAPKIDIKNTEITSKSSGNVNAGSITINSSNLLKLTDNAFINATSFNGNGGTVSIGGHGVISLQNSGIKTTATGATSNGGDITLNSDVMIMDGGMMLASTIGGSGGNITLNLQSLIPSSNSLLKVGADVFDWKPYTKINVIGASGTVNDNAPQMNLSGVLANIGNNNFNNRLVSQDYCAIGKGSSLSKKGKGGLPLRAKDLQVY